MLLTINMRVLGLQCSQDPLYPAGVGWNLDSWLSGKSLKMLPTCVRFKGWNAPKSISAGAMPQTPLGSLQRSSRFPSGWKVEGDQGLGPNIGVQAPRTRPQAGLGVGCGSGSSPPAVMVRGYHPRKIFENSNTKSCILVTFFTIRLLVGSLGRKISCFLKTIAKKLKD